jgi:hypothetical protein
VVLLVRLPEGSELTRAGVAEQVEEVQRALLRRLGSVFDVVRDVEEAAQARARAAGDRCVDPLRDRQVVEFVAPLREAVEERRVAGGRDVLVDRLPGLLDVAGDLGVRVRLAVEVAEHLGAVQLRLEQVVQPEPELLGKVADGVVPLVDQLAAVLGDLPVRERSAERPAAAADSIRCLEDLRGIPGLLQPVGTRQPGETSADHDDARR